MFFFIYIVVVDLKFISWNDNRGKKWGHHHLLTYNYPPVGMTFSISIRDWKIERDVESIEFKLNEM